MDGGKSGDGGRDKQAANRRGLIQNKKKETRTVKCVFQGRIIPQNYQSGYRHRPHRGCGAGRGRSWPS